jgi:tape measure domain-containing protein
VGSAMWSGTKYAAANANKSLTISFKNLVSGAILLKANQLFTQLITNIYDNIKTFDSLSFTLEKITKTTLDYENSQRFLLRITEAYGVELVATTTRWSRFLAAATESGLALREAENIFESMTKASSALALKTDELSSVYLALEQMLSKGKVSTEELRRQLGERLPGAMGIMAASMGVTIPKLDQMLKRGEVLSADVLPNFARAVERAYLINGCI